MSGKDKSFCAKDEGGWAEKIFKNLIDTNSKQPALVYSRD